MNTSVFRRFSAIQGAAAHYMESVTADLALYRDAVAKAKAEADKYREPIASEFLTEKTANARTVTLNSIKAAQETYKNIVVENITHLQSDLADHLLSGINPAFTSTLTVYKTFGIKPTKSEAAALVKLSGGNSVALAAINSVLASSNADYRVDATTADDFQHDLDALEKISDAPIWCRMEDFHELSQVLGGLDNIGRARVLTAGREFETRVQSLSSMSDRWTTSVLPTLKNLADYKPKSSDTGETMTPEDQLNADAAATADAAKIVNSTDTSNRGREIGKQKAATEKRAAETIAHYTA